MPCDCLSCEEVIPIGNSAAQIHRPERSRVEITDPAHADEFLEDAYGVNLRLRRKPTGPSGRGALLRHARTAVGPFAIDEVYVAGDLEAAPDPLNKVVAVWPTGGRVTAACGGKETDAEAGDVAMLSQPDLPYRARSHALRVTTVLLDPSVVAGVATGLPSSEALLPIRFSTFVPVDSSAARLWKDTVNYVRHTVLADDVVATPLVLGHASRLLAAVTLSTFPNTAASDPTPCDRTDHQPVLLRRAMEFMEANITNDIALGDIAEAVHVTPRAVQYMFRRHLETTPLQYLRRLRLHYAHQDLLAANGTADTVTDISARWGFAHTGRFAVLYRRTYGQSPQTTLTGWRK
jgi:AraC-like DNA-binding protein